MSFSFEGLTLALADDPSKLYSVSYFICDIGGVSLKGTVKSVWTFFLEKYLIVEA